ncbi:MAG: diguanylate cyclase [Rhodopirellula sp. JB053]
MNAYAGIITELEAQNREQIAPRTGECFSMKHYRVLLIEDDPMDASIIQRSFQKQDKAMISVDHVSNMGSAIDQLQANSYDVALVDINLPDARGAESFEQLRALDSCLPIIVLTGHDDDELAIHAIQCGAQDYVAKGHFTTASLVRVIRFAIERQRMVLGYLAEADNDPLTGLSNRRNLQRRYTHFLAETQAIGQALFVALIDLDRFKEVNDRYGHCVGDVVLQRSARVLVENASDSSSIVRFGGEEFSVMMKGDSFAEAREQIQTVLKRLEEMTMQIGDYEIRVTASAGLVKAGNNENWEDVFSRCDEMLYRAKASGRNRVESMSELATP